MCVTKIMHHPLRYPGLVWGSFTHWSPLSKWGVACVGRARVRVAVSRRRLRRGASRPRCLHVPGTSVGFLEYHTSVEEQWERLLRTGWAGRPRAEQGRANHVRFQVPCDTLGSLKRLQCVTGFIRNAFTCLMNAQRISTDS